MNRMTTAEIIEDLEEILLRLHIGQINEYEKWQGFKRIKNKKLIIGAKIKEEKEAYKQYNYYQGKFYAYLYVLELFGSEVSLTLKRLRGIKFEGNRAIETKRYYTEKRGHFKE